MTGLVWDVNKLRIATDAAGIAFGRGTSIRIGWNSTNGVMCFGGFPTPELLLSRRSPRVLTPRIWTGYEPPLQLRAICSVPMKRTSVFCCDGKVRWISARGWGDDQGIVGRIMYGVFIDVTERKKAEEAREMLAGEMNHRVKNIFAITSALTSISARSTTTRDEMVKDLRQRIFALSKPTTWFAPILVNRKGRAARKFIRYPLGAVCQHTFKNRARSHFDPGHCW